MGYHDAIDRIASDFRRDCICRLRLLKKALLIIRKSVDFQTAIARLKSELFLDADLHHLTTSIPSEINRIKRCLQNLAETVDTARKVFFVNFFDSEKFFVFNQEICFSYVCKLHHDMGPKLHNFSNNPSNTEIVNAELEVAMHSRMIFSGKVDLFCYETMPERETLFPSTTRTQRQT